MQSHFPLGASTSHAFEMEPLYWTARIITCNHITRLWTTTKAQELIPRSGYLITGLPFSCSSSFTSTSLSSHLYRIKMRYSHFHVFSTQKGLLLFFYIFWVQVSAILLSFLKGFLDNSTRRVSMSCGWIAAVCGKNLFQTHKVPRAIHQLRDELRYQSFFNRSQISLIPRGGDI